MRMFQACRLIGVVCLICHGVFAQTSASTTPDVASILRSSLAAQNGSIPIQDIVLTGTAERIVGPDGETGPAQLKAVSSGSARFDASLSAGIVTELRQVTSSGVSGAWSNGDGHSHLMAGHNMLTDAAWFFPMFVIQRLLSDPKASVTFVGIEGNLGHFQAAESAQTSGSVAESGQLAHWSQIDIYLDSASLLPVRLSFNTHPDDNALLDIPVVVDFSSYETLSGVTMPMHVQRSVNGTLQMDIQLQSASFNTGLSSSAFQF